MNKSLNISKRFRRCIWWGTGIASGALLILGLQLWSRPKLPNHFEQILKEICSIGDFRFAPIVNHAGTQMLYARNGEKGVEIYLLNLTTLERKLLALVSAPESARMNYFHLFGWSPNDGYLIYSMTVDQPNRRMFICTAEGSVLRYFSAPQSMHEGIWLSNESMVFMDEFGNLYVYNMEENVNLGNYRSRGLTALPQAADHDRATPSFVLTRLSDTSFAYGRAGNIWVVDLASGYNRQLTETGAKTLAWLDFNPGNREYLYCQALDNSLLHRYLYRFSPTMPDNQCKQLTSNITFKGQWLYDGGFAYVGTISNRNFISVETIDQGLRTNLFFGGNIYSYSLNPERSKVYAAASADYEPLSIWEYDIRSKRLRPVVPGVASEFRYSRVLTPIERVATNVNGRAVPYYYLQPSGFASGRKYPVVINGVSDNRYTTGPQFLANVGIVYVSIDRNGLASSDILNSAFDDALAVYSDLLQNPEIDSSRIYIAGASAVTGVVAELVNYRPEMWRGVVLMSPVAFPSVPSQRKYFPSVLISIGELDLERKKSCEMFVRNARLASVSLRMVVHAGAAHKLETTRLIQERYREIAKFILTDA
jgi:hypothetical protein